jgi:hypothetical protein
MDAGGGSGVKKVQKLPSILPFSSKGREQRAGESRGARSPWNSEQLQTINEPLSRRQGKAHQEGPLYVVVSGPENIFVGLKFSVSSGVDMIQKRGLCQPAGETIVSGQACEVEAASNLGVAICISILLIRSESDRMSLQ